MNKDTQAALLRATIEKLVERRTTTTPGVLGDGTGRVTVPGAPGYVYVRLGNERLPMKARNTRVANIAGLPVRLGKTIGGTLYIEGTDAAALIAAELTENPEVGAHAENHGPGGSDPVWLATSQIINGLVYAYNGFTIKVNPGWALIDNLAVKITGTSIDLTGDVPVTGALYALVRVDSSGLIDVIDGTPMTSIADLTAAAIPEVADGYVALAAVRLYAGQTALSKTTADPDVLDLRFAPRTGGGGAGTQTFLALTDTPASYVGQAGKFTKVNTEETAIEFVDPQAVTGETTVLVGVKLVDTTVGAAGAASIASGALSLTDYTRLTVHLLARSDKAGATNDSVSVYFNGDTTDANYRRNVYFNTTAGVADNTFLGTVPAATATAGQFAAYKFEIEEPGSSRLHSMSVRGLERRTATEQYVWWGEVFWETAAAITGLAFQPTAGNKFVENSRLVVIGWKEIAMAGIGISDHALMENLNSTDYSHLTATQLTDLTDGGESTLHTHPAAAPAAHATSHKWLGTDQAAIGDLIMNAYPAMFKDWGSMDGFTSIIASSGSITTGLLYLTLSTAANASSKGGVKSNGAFAMVAYGPLLENMRVRLNPQSSLSGCTVYVGFFTNPDSPTATEHHAGFKIINGAIWATCGDGTTQTIVNTGVTTGIYTITELYMKEKASSIEYYVNGARVATLTTNHPNSYYLTLTGVIINSAATVQSILMGPLWVMQGAI